MATVLPPIVLAGKTYRVLRLSGERGPRFLLRNDAGELFGLFAMNGQPTRFQAARLVRESALRENPLAALDFFEVDGELLAE
jgi:hypothetical protein